MVCLHIFREFTKLLSLILIIGIKMASLARMQCPEITQEEAGRMWMKYWKLETQLHWSFWLLPDMQEKYKNVLKPVDLKHIDVNYKEIYGPETKKCPKIGKFFLNLIPECPVYYVMENDPQRIPQNIVHAKCKCKQCLHDNSDEKGCTPVHTYTRVIRRMRDCSFQPVLEAVSVACTCSSKIKFVHV